MIFIHAKTGGSILLLPSGFPGCVNFVILKPSRGGIVNKYIRNLIARGEDQQLDFKFEITDSKKLARTISAYSNTDGGKLLIGVKDNGKIAGIRTDEEFHMIESAAQLFCKPEVIFEWNKWVIDGKTILEVDIPGAKQKPVYAKSDDGRWLAYIRSLDQNLLVNKVQLRVWKKENTRKGVYIRYRDKEKILLDYLKEHPGITRSKFCRIAKISAKTAENILVSLVYLKVIGIVFTEKQTFYHASDVRPVPGHELSGPAQSPVYNPR